MNIVNGFPPNYEKIKAKFAVRDDTVFTYGSTIYTPGSDRTLSEDLMIHEGKHEEQQLTDPEGWWTQYLVDPQFRFRQELAAYRVQYRFFSQHHNRNDNYKFLMLIARDFSGPLYGNIIEYEVAKRLISS